MTKYLILLAAFLFGVFSRANDTNIVDFGDSGVYSSICAVLGVPDGSELTRSQCLQVTNLFVDELWGAPIASFEGLQYASNLAHLGVSLSDEVSFEPLESLSNLKVLRLDGSFLGDVTPLLALTNIIELGLNNAWVTNLFGLASHPSLRVLQRGNSRVTNAEIFPPFWNLEGLVAHGNAIRDVSPFLQMTNLKWLALGGNLLTNVNLLSNNTGLTNLLLGSCGLTNIEFVGGLTNLEALDLAGNKIQDIEVLGGLNKLRLLSLSNNFVTNISSLRNCPLEWLNVGRNFLLATNYDYTPSTQLVFDEIFLRGGTVNAGLQGIWGAIRLSIHREPDGLRVKWFRDPPQTAFRLWFATDGEPGFAIDPDFFVDDSFFFENNGKTETQWFWTELRILGEPIRISAD